jgi:hypothetical protein
MVLWSDIDTTLIEFTPTNKDRTKFSYEKGPLRFQIPRGLCQWGVSAYKSLQMDLSDPEFFQWWKRLEAQLCPGEPFNSNLKGNSLRLKIDDACYIFDENSKQVLPDVREGLFRGQELSCLIDIDSTYFFNGNWGLTVRLYQVRYYGPTVETTGAYETPTGPVLAKGLCAFLPESDA